MNLKFHRNLYLDEKIENKDELIQKISEGIFVFNLYLICISRNINHIFEILYINEIFKDINKDEYIVIGMSYGKKQAFNIVNNIFENYIFNKKDVSKIKQNFMKNK